MSKTKYYTFPVLLLKDAHGNQRGTFDKIIDYGLYQFATAISESNNQEFDDCFSESFSFFGLKNDNVESILATAITIANSIPDNPPMTSVNAKVILEYYKEAKTEFEITCLCGFAAIKSIIGRKPYTKITNEYFLARMFGFAKVEDMKSCLSPMLEKYAKRYHLNRVKDELKVSWGVKLYGRNTRGFYASISMDYESLVFQVEKNRKSRIRQERKAEEAEAQKRVLDRLRSK